MGNFNGGKQGKIKTSQLMQSIKKKQAGNEMLHENTSIPASEGGDTRATGQERYREPLPCPQVP